MPLWSDRLAQDRAVLDDFLAWVKARERALIDDVFTKHLSLEEAIGMKKVLDELVRCATMNAREEQVNAEFKRVLASRSPH